MTQPKPTGGPDGTFAPEDVERIVLLQRFLLVGVLIHILIVISQFMIPPESRPLLALIAIPIDIAVAVVVCMLAIKIQGVVVGIFLTLIALIPCVGLGVLLLVNSQATDILRRHGYKVGFFGAK